MHILNWSLIGMLKFFTLANKISLGPIFVRFKSKFPRQIATFKKNSRDKIFFKFELVFIGMFSLKIESLFENFNTLIFTCIWPLFEVSLKIS